VSALRVLILDFDGVILESNGVKTAVFEEVFAQFPEHHDAMMSFHIQHQSASRYVKFAHLVEERLGRAGDQDLINQLASDFSARIEERMATCPMVPGATSFLDRYSGMVPLYLASVTPQTELNRTLLRRGVNGYFRRAYGCPPWSKENAIVDVVSQHGGTTDGVVLIGDSAGDQRAAGVTGVEFVARDSGLPFDSPPACMCNDMNDAMSVLSRREIQTA